MTDIIDPLTKQPWFEYNAGEKLIRINETTNTFVQEPSLIKEMISKYNHVLPTYPKPMKAKINYGIPAKYLRNTTEEWLDLFGRIKTSLISYENQIMSKQFPEIINNRDKDSVLKRKEQVLKYIDSINKN
ncbi:hypothetical protein [Guptibacillus hwajinpoensis]|uniref:hypothetical protein n=1 Tax=Guptibacillus hwajinpoensis TaxID=208199 RepID=UPI0024B33301|nr:hypothetical protein [Pseudalkalibacillus hwajinpoensis]